MEIISKRIGNFIGFDKKSYDVNGTKVHPEVDVNVVSLIPSEIKDFNSMKQVGGTADGAKFGNSGFISPTTSVFKIVEKAHEEGRVVLLRFERFRKENIAADIPIEELTKDMNTAKDSIIKTLVGVYDFNNDEWVLTEEAKTIPSKDPENIMNGIKSLNVNVDNFFVSKSTGGSETTFAPSVNKERENKENALISMYFFLVDQEKAHNYKIPQSEKLKLAKVLLKLANYLQMETFNLEEPVYSAYSHTRARFMLFQLTEKLIPLDEDAYNDIQSWAGKIQASGVELWDWALTEVDTF